MFTVILTSFLTALASGIAGAIVRKVEKTKLRKENKLID